MKGFLRAAAGNQVLATSLFLVVCLAGCIAVSQMVREDMPVMAEDTVQVSMTWDGADPGSVEQGILRKIETATQGMEGVLGILTTAEDNHGEAIFTIRQGYDPQKVMDRIRAAVETIATFPDKAKKPVIIRPALSFAVMTLAVSGDVGEKAVMDTARQIQKELLALDAVSRVSLDTVREEQIHVDLSLEALERYHLDMSGIARVIAENNLDLAGGQIKAGTRTFRIRTLGKKQTRADIGKIILLTGPDGEQVSLSRVARIRDSFVMAPSVTRVNGVPGALINIYKTRKEDALDIAESVTAYVRGKQESLDPRLSLGILFDASLATAGRIKALVRNGAAGLACVLLILWIFVDGRLAFWVAAGLPFSIMGGLAVLWFWGGSLNTVSLFSLIMVLGILADDAIVVGEAILFHKKRGKTGIDAVSSGLREVGRPVVIAVATSIIAFVPLLFLPGTMGRFIAILPITVIACLAVSLVECLVILPAHLNFTAKTSESALRNRAPTAGADLFHSLRAAADQGLDQFVLRVYTPFIRACLGRRYLTLCTGISFLLIITGLFLGGFLRFDLFPDPQGTVITATLEYPDSTRISQTLAGVDRLEKALNRATAGLKDRSGRPVVLNRITLAGHLLGDEAGEIEESGENFGSVQAVLALPDERDVHTRAVIDLWQAAMGDPGAATLSFFSDSVGMPGPPIELYLLGQDPGHGQVHGQVHGRDRLVAAGNEVMAALEGFEGVYQVRSDHARYKKEIQISLRPEARALGISLKDLSSQVRNAFFGAEALTLQRQDQEVKVYVRLAPEARENLETLGRMKIVAPDGRRVALASVARLTQGRGLTRIIRKDRLRKLGITARVIQETASADEIMEAFSRQFLPQFREKYPDIGLAQGGDEEEEAKAFDGLIIGFPMALLVIYLLICAALRSYVLPLTILFIIPFGIAGALLSHFCLGLDLSLMSVFGMVAATGVLINDAIVLMESIRMALAQGRPVSEAVCLGSQRRFRAVFLTTVSTIAGLLPLVAATSPHIQLVVPMAVSIAGGIAFSTLITLVLVPGLVLVFHDLGITFPT